MGLTFRDCLPEALFYWASDRDFMILKVLPDSNNLICNEKGELLNFMITPGDIDDREP